MKLPAAVALGRLCALLASVPAPALSPHEREWIERGLYPEIEALTLSLALPCWCEEFQDELTDERERRSVAGTVHCPLHGSWLRGTEKLEKCFHLHRFVLTSAGNAFMIVSDMAYKTKSKRGPGRPPRAENVIACNFAITEDLNRALDLVCLKYRPRKITRSEYVSRALMAKDAIKRELKAAQVEQGVPATDAAA